MKKRNSTIRIKKKFRKKLSLCKAIEGKVPVAGEKSKELPSIPFAFRNVVGSINWYTNDDLQKNKVKCKILEEWVQIWESAALMIDPEVGQATCQTVNLDGGIILDLLGTNQM